MLVNTKAFEQLFVGDFLKIIKINCVIKDDKSVPAQRSYFVRIQNIMKIEQKMD